MNAVISITNAATPQTMSSREIAELCNARHNDVVATIQRLFDQGILRESRNIPRAVPPEGRGRPIEVYDLTKRDTLVVVSGYSAELRAKIIDRWQELETKAHASDPMAVLNDPAAMRGLLLGYTEKVIALETQVSEMRSDVEALDRLARSEGSLCITDAAKTIGVQPKVLFAFLRSHHWIYTRAGSNMEIAYQDKLAYGFLEHKTTTVTRSDGSEKSVTQVRVTPKGLARLAKELPPQIREVK